MRKAPATAGLADWQSAGFVAKKKSEISVIIVIIVNPEGRQLSKHVEYLPEFSIFLNLTKNFTANLVTRVT